MILIVGGLGAGKRDFARRELGVREEELSPADRQNTFTNMMKIALEVAVKMAD